MINPQFTYDNLGKKVGVFLAIEDWDQLEKLPQVIELAQSDDAIPDWHKNLVEKELSNIENGKADLMKWEEAKTHFKL